jgi:signal peptidase I
VATTAKERDKLESEILARRSEAQRRASKRLYWLELLTSLWAPPSVFGIALILYIVLIELIPPTHLWAQPALKSLGLLMIAWFFALLAWRAAFPQARNLRRLRHQAREASLELQRLMQARGKAVDSKVREKLIEQAAELDAVRITGDVGKLEAELKKLSALTDKHLATGRHNSTLDFAIGFGKALAIALLIRTIIIEPFRIPSGSMIPTLEIGDQIFVNKFIYGVRIPWLNKVPFVIVRSPKRGDVIVFNNPVDDSKDFIKRVVGLPGDEVKLVNEIVYINGEPQPRKLSDSRYTYYNKDDGNWYAEQVELYQEILAGYPHATIQSHRNRRAPPIEGPWHIPAGHVFVLGDNRDNSMDSRYGLGVTGKIEFVPYGNIKGKAMVIWLSLSHDGLLYSLFGGTGLRTDRLFLPVR